MSTTVTLDAFLASTPKRIDPLGRGRRHHPRDRRGGRGRSGRIVAGRRIARVATVRDRHQHRRRPADGARRRGGPHLPRCRATRAGRRLRVRGAGRAGASSIPTQPLALADRSARRLVERRPRTSPSARSSRSCRRSRADGRGPLRELPAARQPPARRRARSSTGRGSSLVAQRRRRHARLRIQRPAGGYRARRESTCAFPTQATEFAINASNYRHWDEFVRLYFDDCVKGVHGPRERDFNMRWLASLVVEAYRILVRGGVFLYPADKRAGLRQAGGCASSTRPTRSPS